MGIWREIRTQYVVAQSLATHHELQTAEVIAADRAAGRLESELESAVHRRDRGAALAALDRGANIDAVFLPDAWSGGRRGHQTLLTAACGWQGELGTVTLLLELGADPRAVDGSGSRPLHRAATVAVARALVQAGAAIDDRCRPLGYTPLFSALHSPDLCRYFLGIGSDPNTTDDIDGSAPLHELAFKGSTHSSPRKVEDTVRLLLRAGADPRQTNLVGLTPQDLAAREGHRWLLPLLRT